MPLITEELQKIRFWFAGLRLWRKEQKTVLSPRLSTVYNNSYLGIEQNSNTSSEAAFCVKRWTISDNSLFKIKRLCWVEHNEQSIPHTEAWPNFNFTTSSSLTVSIKYSVSMLQFVTKMEEYNYMSAYLVKGQRLKRSRWPQEQGSWSSWLEYSYVLSTRRLILAPHSRLLFSVFRTLRRWTHLVFDPSYTLAVSCLYEPSCHSLFLVGWLFQYWCSIQGCTISQYILPREDKGNNNYVGKRHTTSWSDSHARLDSIIYFENADITTYKYAVNDSSVPHRMKCSEEKAILHFLSEDNFLFSWSIVRNIWI